ncbi:MAG: hypothetical protein U1F43_08265 [Myxococcota bacterium]
MSLFALAPGLAACYGSEVSGVAPDVATSADADAVVPDGDASDATTPDATTPDGSDATTPDVGDATDATDVNDVDTTVPPEWETLSLGDLGAITDLVAVSKTLAYAVSDTRVLRWNGSTWLAYGEPGGTTKLHGVWGGDGQVVVVGDGGFVARRLDGAEWETLDAGTTLDLWDVDGRSGDDVWVVGAKGQVRHYDGTAWSQEFSKDTLDLRSLTLDKSTADGLLAVGTGGQAVGQGRYLVNNAADPDAIVAAQIAGGTVVLSDVLIKADGSLVAVGTGHTITAKRKTDPNWKGQASNDERNRDVAALAQLPDGTVLAFGADGVVLKQDGTVWSVVPTAAVAAGLKDFAAAAVLPGSGVDVLVLATDGGGVRYDGTSWVSIATRPDAAVKDLESAPDGTVWAAGSAGLLMSRGVTGWSAVTLPEAVKTADLEAVAVQPNGTVWAVGSGGAIIKKVGDAAATRVASPLPLDLFGVAANADGVVACARRHAHRDRRRRRQRAPERLGGGSARRGLRRRRRPVGGRRLRHAAPRQRRGPARAGAVRRRRQPQRRGRDHRRRAGRGRQRRRALRRRERRRPPERDPGCLPPGGRGARRQALRGRLERPRPARRRRCLGERGHRHQPHPRGHLGRRRRGARRRPSGGSPAPPGGTVIMRADLRTLAAGALALTALTSACSDGKRGLPADAFDTADTAVAPDTSPDAADDSDVADDSAEPDDADVVDTVDAADTVDADDTADAPDVELTEPGSFELGTADLDTEFVFKGVWAGEAGRIVAVGNDGVVATRDPAGVWKTLIRAEGASVFNAVHGVDGQHLWAVGTGGVILPGTVDSFGQSEACEGDGDCTDSDACTNDRCVDHVCVAEPTGAAGCCGSSPASWSFDAGTLDGWASLAAEKIGPWSWQAVAIPFRATSGTYALYFGNPAAVPPTYDANGVQVAGTALSPPFKLPSTGTATLRFSAFVDVEPGAGFDDVFIEVQSGSERTEVWSKADIGTIPTPGFIESEVDLTPWRGRTISLRVRFDSTDGTFNTFEGVYLDDIHIETACTTQGVASAQNGPTLWGVYATSPTAAFAVGKDGTILSWNGTAWGKPQGADPTAVWNGIYGYGDERLAFVGNAGLATASFGSGLQNIATGLTSNLHSVYTPDGESWFATGDKGALMHGTGTSWVVDDLGLGMSFRDVHGRSASDVYAVGYQGTVVHWDGSAWGPVGTDTTINLLGVWVDSDGKVTALGKDGLILQGDATSLVTVGTFYSGGDLNDLWGTGDGTFYAAVGTGGRALLFRNGTWGVVETSSSQTLESVFGTAADDVWAVGRSGTALHWDGTAFTRATMPTSAALNAIWGSAKDRYFTVGSGGTLLAYNGTSWETITTPALQNLRAVYSRTPSDAWAVGAAGTVIHYGGLGWGSSKVEGIPNADGGEDPIPEELHAVWAAAANDAWAVGQDGRLLHWDGSIWHIVDNDFTTTLRGIYGLASNDIWAVGNEGLIIHWNGEEWQQVETGSIATLYAIHGDGHGHVVVVGDIGTVLQLVRD